MSILSLKETTSKFFSDFDNLTKDIFEGNGAPYPETSPLTPKLERGKAFKVLPYGFKVEKANGGGTDFLPSLSDFNNPFDPKASTVFRKLDFDLNPQSISQDEIYSISITPTFGGVVREHNGLVLRDLVITGTTGVNPNRGPQGLTEGVETGYSNIHRLINYFRAYGAEMKTSPSFRAESLLIFVNRKDGEQLIVEPLKITRKKTAPKGTLYEYNLTFKIIGPYQPQSIFPEWLQTTLDGMESFGNVVEDIYSRFQAARGILILSQNSLTGIRADIVDTILEPLRQVTSFMQSYSNFQQTLLDLPADVYNDIKKEGGAQLRAMSSIEKDITSPSTLKYSNNDTENKRAKKGKNISADDNLGSFMAGEGIDPAAMAKTDVASVLTDAQMNIMMIELEKSNRIQRDKVRKLINSLQDLSDKMAELSNLSDDTYTEFLEGLRTVEEDVPVGKEATNEEIDILYAISEIKINLEYLISSPELFTEDPTSRATQARNAFNNTITILQPGSVKVIVIDNEATLLDIASTHLGNSLRWVDIAQLNNLEPPYITGDLSQVGPHVLTYGDTLLIPLDQGTNIPQNDPLEKLPINRDLNALERNLGVDLMLGSNNDLVISNNDLKLIASSANALQAVRLKMLTSLGELRHHLGYGFPLDVGEKITSLTPTDVYDAIYQSIMSDTRFQDVRDITINYNNSTITVGGVVVPKNGGLPVPLILRF